MRLVHHLEPEEQDLLHYKQILLASVHGDPYSFWHGKEIERVLKLANDQFRTSEDEFILSGRLYSDVALGIVSKSREFHSSLIDNVGPNTSPLDLMELYDVWVDVEHARDGDDTDDGLNIYLCTSIERHFNARTFPLITPHRKIYVVMFNNRIFDMLADVAYIYRLAFENFVPLAESPLRQRLSCGTVDLSFGTNTKLDEAIYRFFERHALLSDVPPDYDRWADEEPDLGYCIYQCMKYFIVAHEVAHVSLGHLERQKTTHIVSPSGDEKGDITEVDRNHQEEIDADTVGWDSALSIGIKNGFHPEIMDCAAALFFMSVGWIESFRAACLPEVGSSGDSHPSSESRLKFVVDVVGSVNGDMKDHVRTSLSTVHQLDEEVRKRINQTFAGPGAS